VGHWLYNAFAFQVSTSSSRGARLVSTALSINRLWDAFSDPVFGWMSDNTRSRFGRRRPYILIGGVLAGQFPRPLRVAPVVADAVFRLHAPFLAVYVRMMSCFNRRG
jgi:GPH family glycoside/pentoside/hexuronide:cation symporter